MHRRSCSSERNVPETNLAHLGPAIRWRRHASTLARPEPTARQLRLADGHASTLTRPEPTATQQAGIDDTDKCSDTPGANVRHRHYPASSQEHARNLHTGVHRACLSRQSSLERKASATDKCPASLRTASHFLCPGNGTLFYGEKRYVRYGAAFLFGKVPIRTPNEGS